MSAAPDIAYGVAAEPAWYPRLRIALFALLACNTVYYVATGTLSEALDACAWLVLLALFQLEAGWPHRVARMAVAVRAVRLAAAVTVGAAAIGYVDEGAWLDVINTALWIAVVALLEFELRRPSAVARSRSLLSAAAVSLYAGLAILVLMWAWRGEWFDAYDATLWLGAFSMIEMDVLQVFRARVRA